MDFNAIHIAFVLAWATVFVYKLRHLSADWGSPRLWAVCASIFFPMVAHGLAPPVVQIWVNRAVGVPNVTHLLVACTASGSAAAWLSLAMFWRYPLAKASSRVRWVIAAYVLDAVVMIALFGAADVPEEHIHQEFGIYYVPRQLAIFIYYLFFLVPMTAGVLILSLCCLRWPRRADYAHLPWLRRALFLVGVSTLTYCGYFFVQIAAIVAVRFGSHALDTAADVALVVAMLVAIPLLPVAWAMPVWGRRWPTVCSYFSRWRTFCTLRLLHRRLRHVDPATVVVAPGRRRDPHHRVRRMVIELSDWRWTLAPLFDPAVAEKAAALGRKAGLTGERLKTTVEAAQLRAASDAWRRGVRPEASVGADDEELRDGTGVDTEIAWWMQVARAFARSPRASR